MPKYKISTEDKKTLWKLHDHLGPIVRPCKIVVPESYRSHSQNQLSEIMNKSFGVGDFAPEIQTVRTETRMVKKDVYSYPINHFKKMKKILARKGWDGINDYVDEMNSLIDKLNGVSKMRSEMKAIRGIIQEARLFTTKL